MDDKLKEIRKEYIEGNTNMEIAELTNQDLFDRFIEHGILKLSIKINTDGLTSIHPQAVVDYLNEMRRAHNLLKYYQENVDKEEVKKLYE